MKTFWLVVSSLLLATHFSHAAGIDRNGNGLSDIWELIYSASAPALPGNVTFPSTYLGTRLQMIAKAI